MFPRSGAHQLGQEAFKTILAEEVDWKPFPAFPPSVRLAVVVGQPSEPGPPDNRDGAAWTGIPQRDGRPAKQQLLGGVSS